MNDPQIGQVASVKRTFTQEDFDRFAILSGDDNPIHVDPVFSARTKFGRTVAHGMLLYSTVGGVLGTLLPGPGTIQVDQDLIFPNATYVGEEVTISLEVTDIQPEKRQAELSTVITKPDGNVGLQGRTLVRLPGAVQTDHNSSKSSIYPPSPPLKGMTVGMCAKTHRTFTADDLLEYADLANDANSVFASAEEARQLGLEGQIIPGGLFGGLFSYVLGTELPGRGTNYLKQRLEFVEYAHTDQELTASVEIARIRPEKQLVNLITTCTNPCGEIVCRGEALVLVSDLETST
jgi:acyl dehydratase